MNSKNKTMRSVAAVTIYVLPKYWRKPVVEHYADGTKCFIIGCPLISLRVLTNE